MPPAILRPVGFFAPSALTPRNFKTDGHLRAFALTSNNFKTDGLLRAFGAHPLQFYDRWASSRLRRSPPTILKPMGFFLAPNILYTQTETSYIGARKSEFLQYV